MDFSLIWATAVSRASRSCRQATAGLGLKRGELEVPQTSTWADRGNITT